MKKEKLSEKEILHMHKKGMSYGEIAKAVGTTRQNIHRIVKYKDHPFTLTLFGWIITFKKKKE